jgi:anti-anti-sigma regulatory factor
MLKITRYERPDVATLQLEGSVTGPWVHEFQQAWHSVAASLGSRRLSLDLHGVTQMNSLARELLAEIYKRTGAEFISNTPMIKYFSKEPNRKMEDDYLEGK